MGDLKELDENRTAALVAVLAHRSGRLLQNAAEADRTLDLDYLPLQDISTPGNCAKVPMLSRPHRTGAHALPAAHRHRAFDRKTQTSSPSAPPRSLLPSA